MKVYSRKAKEKKAITWKGIWLIWNSNSYEKIYWNYKIFSELQNQKRSNNVDGIELEASLCWIISPSGCEVKKSNKMNFVQSYNAGHELVLQDEKQIDPNLPSITEFYKDQEIFVTGGSGFMGKVLIEKLLRSCTGIKVIYVLIRPKKGKSIEERIAALKELPLFVPLKKSNPKMLEKMVGIPGDVTKLNLGISDEDMKRMENVSIIFHSAASVRWLNWDTVRKHQINFS